MECIQKHPETRPLFLGAKGHVFPKIACTYSHVLIMVVLHETLSTQSFSDTLRNQTWRENPAFSSMIFP